VTRTFPAITIASHGYESSGTKSLLNPCGFCVSVRSLPGLQRVVSRWSTPGRLPPQSCFDLKEGVLGVAFCLCAADGFCLLFDNRISSSVILRSNVRVSSSIRLPSNIGISFPTILPFDGRISPPTSLPFDGGISSPAILPFDGRVSPPTSLPFGGRVWSPAILPFDGRVSSPTSLPFDGRISPPSVAAAVPV